MKRGFPAGLCQNQPVTGRQLPYQEDLFDFFLLPARRPRRRAGKTRVLFITRK
ncbi:MAG: hypothetical protein MZV64_34425 [Ignavibacteriales bacterium]|nr:hypothetical protein [Ignavibacteriales bacterium]